MMASKSSAFHCGANKTCGMPPPQVLAAYGVFMLSAATVWHLVADGAFSSVLTLSVMMQCLSFLLLGLQVLSSSSVSGISAKALMLDALALCCRLSSTLWLNGYLPVDASGDHVFQAIDICSLVIIVWLLHQAFVTRQRTYQAEEDSLPISRIVLVAGVLAALLHADINSRPLFDTLWMAGLFLGSVSVVPQLWLITKTGGCVEALTSHHIATMAASKLLSGVFMWHARHDITCVPWITGFSHAIWAILGAHALHTLLLGDFAYYYIKAVMSRGLNCRIDVLESCGV